MNTSSTKTEVPLSEKEQAFFESMKRKIAHLQGEIPARFAFNVAFRFEVPNDFTQQEFDRVGRELTGLRWDWETIRKQGQSGWSFILLQI